jgi:hypothetical protein
VRHSALTAMQIQRLRRFALHVLLAWVFALATGVVNACVMQVDLPESAHASAHGGHALVGDADHSMPHETDGHEHESHAGKPPCERCCDEPSALPQQAASQKSDSPSGFWLVSLPAPSFTWAASRVARLDGIPPRWGATIPIPIAFLRLAL